MNFKGCVFLLLVGCASSCVDSSVAETIPEEQEIRELYPNVLKVEATKNPDGSYRFEVTLESRYDSPERYADAWRILSLDGEELGVRILRHDHANEQPFTRSLNNVRIPEGIERVRFQGRDQRSGWGGDTKEIDLPR